MIDLKDKLIMAPLAGYSDLIFRSLARRNGADITVTEMVSIKGVVYKQPKTFDLVRSDGTDRPLGIQLFGSEPDLFAEAAAIVAEKFKPDFIDVNCGCPVRKVLKQKAGAWLLQDPPRIGAIVKAIKKAVAVPVSVKIRLGFTDEDRNYLEVCRTAEENGVDFIAVHARTRPGLYSAAVDLDALARIRRAVGVPIAGNGGVCDIATYRAMKETGCEAVMIGQAAMAQPWLFRELAEAVAGHPRETSFEEKLGVFKGHISAMMELKGEEEGLRQSRSLAMQYIRKIFRGLPCRKDLMREFYALTTRDGMELFFRNLGP